MSGLPGEAATGRMVASPSGPVGYKVEEAAAPGEPCHQAGDTLLHGGVVVWSVEELSAVCRQAQRCGRVEVKTVQERAGPPRG